MQRTVAFFHYHRDRKHVSVFLCMLQKHQHSRDDSIRTKCKTYVDVRSKLIQRDTAKVEHVVDLLSNLSPPPQFSSFESSGTHLLQLSLAVPSCSSSILAGRLSYSARDQLPSSDMQASLPLRFLGNFVLSCLVLS